jgi:hypothetical protein
MRTRHQQILSLIERFANKEPVQRIIDTELLAAKLELDISFVQDGKEDGTVKNYIDDLTILRTNYE